MTWNWQKEDWPHFTYKKKALEQFEAQFLRNSGVVVGALMHLATDEKNQLTVDLMSNEALKTSEIENEYLDRWSLQSSIRNQLGLATNAPRVPPAEQGVAEMMVHLYRTFDDPLSDDMLFRWHAMLMQGRRDLREVGAFRAHEDAMQVVSGLTHKPKVHFEAPPSSRVPSEMDRFIGWFNNTRPERPDAPPPLIRAGIAHLYFESVHPFEDGNGRIGRAVSEKSLAQSLRAPTLLALAHSIERRRKDYYSALEAANASNEITDWLVYFAKMVLDAQDYTHIRVEFLIEKAKFYDRLRGHLNERQEKVIARMFREGPDGFRGGLSAENYISITRTSSSTATRDLQDLVTKDALTRSGQRKHTRYQLNLSNLA